MATKIKLDQGIYLTPLNSESLLEIQDNLEARCFMCREILTNENKTVEHIYPKELYDLMKNVLQLRGVTDEIPEYVEGKMFSFIPRKV